MTAARLGLAAAAACAFIAATAPLPAAAQTTAYPAGTDCTKLVGNSKTECQHQAKMSGAPDNSNNPSNSTINTTTGTGPTTGTTDSMPSSTTTPGAGEDCTSMVGNTKKECEHRAKMSPNPDNSNNPSQQQN
jgi:hypothetical protein